MNVFESLAVKIPDAVLLSAVDEDVSKEVGEYLESYGTVNRAILIDEPVSEYYNMWIIEFESGSSLTSLNEKLSFTHVTSTGETCLIQSLSKIYTTDIGSSKTKNYLADLKNVAKLSGKDYAEVLQEMMAQISGTIAELPAKDEPSDEDTVNIEPHKMASTSSSIPDPPQSARPKGRPSSINLSASDLNPPAVHRYVVEHRLTSEDIAMHTRSSHRLRVFSGRVPRPQHEVDYDTWRSGADLIMKDPAISDIQRSRLILDSLLPPAADIVKHLSPDLSPDIYIDQLDSAFGTVQDGEELFAKFMDTFQNAGENSSTYLQRLQVALSLAVKRGGVSESDVNKHLLNQFCRGCWDNTLISELQLKQRKATPPSFAELLLLLRTEEDREAAKTQRMRQHLGNAKQKVSSHAQFVSSEEEKGMCAAFTSLTKQLTEQMAAIQQQLAALTSAQSHGPPPSNPRISQATKPRTKPKMNSTAAAAASSPKPGFCFRCGEDGHIKPQCSNPPNSALVSTKRKQFNERKQRWQNRTSRAEQLN